MTEQPTPDHARRERYAAAIFDASAASAGEYAYADAAMAVADEEQRKILPTARNALEAWKRENARLREELARQTKLTDAYKTGTQLAAIRFQARIGMLENALEAGLAYQPENVELRAALDRVRAMHERRDGDSGSPYCDLCADHGDVNWPCATIAALNTSAAAPAEVCPGYETEPNRCACPCAGCRHNCAAHQSPATEQTEETP